MKVQRSTIILLVLAALVLAGFDIAHAAIGPVDASTGQPLTSNVAFTASVFDVATRTDITDDWLPEWSPPPAGQPIASGGTPIYVVFHDATGAVVVPTVTRVLPTSAQASLTALTGSVNPFVNPLSTSTYPGQCTNFGSSSDLSPDFDLDPTDVGFTTSTGLAKRGFRLTPLDCGGMAVITATVGGTTHTFVLPRSSNASGIPDIWAAAFCPANSCPTGREDADPSPNTNIAVGDGIFAFDEYRGFIVSGVHVRTDPGRKDLFTHLVNPQCGTNSLLGGGTTTYVSGNALFSNADTLIAGTRVHRLGYATPNATHLRTHEWVDEFDSYSVQTGLLFTGGTTTAPAPDRQVNKNSVFFTLASGSNLADGTRVVQKGLRVIECLDTSAPSLLGFASLGSPNGPDNAIIFTQRIVNYFVNELGATCATPTTACLSYSTFQNGAWSTPVLPRDSKTSLQILALALAFYVAHEMGHSLDLTPTVEGDRKTSYGYHHAPGTGSNLDQAITNKVSNKTGNTFYIPLLYNTSDLESFEVK
jgi:hypothetical protein